ncbi:SGNH/GDSL hydrolase family protein [Georgenia thermotolerans]|nr:SGNH/GDSL hydrolase family protein [Georgenia thermotolerans]
MPRPRRSGRSRQRSKGRTLGVVGSLALVSFALVAVTLLRTHPTPTEVLNRPQPAVTLPSRNPLALVIGDSQAMGGFGVGALETWVAQGLRSAGFQPVIVGYPGTGYVHDRPAHGDQDGHPNYVTSLREGLYNLPPADHVQLVVLEGGGNDAFDPAKDISAAAREAIRLVREEYPEAEVLMLGPLNQAGDPRSLRVKTAAVLAAVATEEDVPFIDATSWVADAGVAGELVDGLHFTQKGHTALAPYLGDALSALGVEAEPLPAG